MVAEPPLKHFQSSLDVSTKTMGHDPFFQGPHWPKAAVHQNDRNGWFAINHVKRTFQRAEGRACGVAWFSSFKKYFWGCLRVINVAASASHQPWLTAHCRTYMPNNHHTYTPPQLIVNNNASAVLLLQYDPADRTPLWRVLSSHFWNSFSVPPSNVRGHPLQ